MKLIKKIVGGVRLWLVERLGTCAGMAPVMSKAVDRRLGPGTWVKLQLHLAVCKWCRRYLEQIRLINRTAGSPEVAACSAKSPGLSAEARRRIAASLNVNAKNNH